MQPTVVIGRLNKDGLLTPWVTLRHPTKDRALMWHLTRITVGKSAAHCCHWETQWGCYMFSSLLIVLCHKIHHKGWKSRFSPIKTVRQNPKWKACVWDYRYACCIQLTCFSFMSSFFFLFLAEWCHPHEPQCQDKRVVTLDCPSCGNWPC